MATIGNLFINLIAKTAAFDKRMKRSRRRIERFGKRVGAVEKRLGGMAKRMAKIGVALTAGGFVLAIRQAMNFEQQMAMVSTMLDEMTMKHMPDFQRGIQALAVEFGQSTETLAKGLYDILSASIAPAKALDVLRASTVAAVAGFTDTATAVDAITSVLNSYGLEAKRASDIADWFFAVVKRGKTTFPELAESIGRVAATAKTAGVRLEDLGAVIATMTKAGIKTPETMTAITSMLKAFIKPTREGAKTARGFGFELKTATLRSEGLVKVLGRLRGASAEQLIQMFPLIRGMKGVAAVVEDATGVAEDYNAVLERGGAAQTAYAKAAGTFATKFAKLRERFKEILVAVGERLLPSVSAAADKLTAWLGTNKGVMVEWARKALLFFQTVTATLLKATAWMIKNIGGLFLTKQAKGPASTFAKTLKGMEKAIQLVDPKERALRGKSASFMSKSPVARGAPKPRAKPMETGGEWYQRRLDRLDADMAAVRLEAGGGPNDNTKDFILQEMMKQDKRLWEETKRMRVAVEGMTRELVGGR